MDVARLVELNAAYARVIDNEKFEEWPKLLVDMEKDAHVKPEERVLIERYLLTMSARVV